MYGGKNTDIAIKMGIVIELIHAYLVIEDDSKIKWNEIIKK